MLLPNWRLVSGCGQDFENFRIHVENVKICFDCLIFFWIFDCICVAVWREDATLRLAPGLRLWARLQPSALTYPAPESSSHPTNDQQVIITSIRWWWDHYHNQPVIIESPSSFALSTTLNSCWHIFYSPFAFMQRPKPPFSYFPRIKSHLSSFSLCYSQTCLHPIRWQWCP